MIALTTSEKIWCAVFCLLFAFMIWAFWMTFNETLAGPAFLVWMRLLECGAIYCVASTVLHPMFGWFFLYRWIDWVCSAIILVTVFAGWSLQFIVSFYIFFVDLFAWLRWPV